MANRDGHSDRPNTLQSLRLLAEDAQLEVKRSNEGDPSQSDPSELLESPSPERVEMGQLRWTLVSGRAISSATGSAATLGGRSPPPAQKHVPQARGVERANPAPPDFFRGIFDFPISSEVGGDSSTIMARDDSP
jgi:hypothetical protein